MKMVLTLLLTLLLIGQGILPVLEHRAFWEWQLGLERLRNPQLRPEILQTQGMLDQRLRELRQLAELDGPAGNEVEDQWQLWAGSFAGGRQDRLRRLSLQGWSASDWRHHIEQRVLDEDWLQRQWRLQALPHQPPAPLKAAQPDSPQIEVPLRWHVQHLFLTRHAPPRSQRAELISLIDGKLKAGADWTTLVAQYSEDERSAQLSGELGWVSARRMPAEFIAALEGLGPRAMTGPVATRLGWHWIRLIQRRDARAATPEELHAETQALQDCLRRRQWLERLLQSSSSEASQTGGNSRLLGP